MASGNDMKAARQSYENFVTMVKWATPVCALVALFVVVLIAQ
ncbi:aa3-type cytochrome c oxidase subunit IV [Caenibius sp. WL]|nr:aa3-type cytochrome c oxidase subunit IV [Caenibius sp. WL]QZP09598.1 aa3-type cytochrome c oxidase subunit IV [Caenibius sp. WL]